MRTSKISVLALLLAGVLLVLWWISVPTPVERVEDCRRMVRDMRAVAAALQAFQLKEVQPRLKGGEMSDALLERMTEERVSTGALKVIDRWGRRFRYEAEGSGIEVFSVGEDGRVSHDDILLSKGPDACLSLGAPPHREK